MAKPESGSALRGLLNPDLIELRLVRIRNLGHAMLSFMSCTLVMPCCLLCHAHWSCHVVFYVMHIILDHSLGFLYSELEFAKQFQGTLKFI